MPDGKPAGVVCVNLDRERGLCTIWNSAYYPEVCAEFTAVRWICADTREEALSNLARLEQETTA